MDPDPTHGKQTALRGWRLACMRAAAVVATLLALVPIVATFGPEAALRAEQDAIEAARHGLWALAFAPPADVAALSLLAPLALGLVLVWRRPVREDGARLAFVVLLWTVGQALVVEPRAWDRILVDGWRAHLAASWPPWARALYLRAFVGPFLPLLWPVSWILAAATFVGFARLFPRRLRAPDILAPRTAVPTDRIGSLLHALGLRAPIRRPGRFEAWLSWSLVSWLCLATVMPRGWWPLSALGLLVGVGGLAGASRLPRGAAALTRALAVASIVVALNPYDDRVLAAGMAVGLFVLLARSRALTSTAPRGFWIVPLGWSAVWVLSSDASRSLRLLPWIPVALFEGLRYLRFGYLAASATLRARVLWVYVGFVVAGTLALFWLVLARGGGLAGCSASSRDVFCRAVAYQDWLLLLPLPAVVVFLAVAVFYSGAVDPELVLRRTATASAVAVVVIALFGWLEHELGKLVEPNLPHGTPDILSAGLTALAVHPVRRWCERGVERGLELLLAIGAVGAATSRAPHRGRTPRRRRAPA